MKPYNPAPIEDRYLADNEIAWAKEAMRQGVEFDEVAVRLRVSKAALDLFLWRSIGRSMRSPMF